MNEDWLCMCACMQHLLPSGWGPAGSRRELFQTVSSFHIAVHTDDSCGEERGLIAPLLPSPPRPLPFLLSQFCCFCPHKQLLLIKLLQDSCMPELQKSLGRWGGGTNEERRESGREYKLRECTVRVCVNTQLFSLPAVSPRSLCPPLCA